MSQEDFQSIYDDFERGLRPFTECKKHKKTFRKWCKECSGAKDTINLIDDMHEILLGEAE